MESAATHSATHRFRIAEIDSGNASDMRDLFARIFGKPMSQEFWDWKYRRSGGHGMGVWDGDVLVAHYGGAGCDTVFDGRIVHTVQICDVMVDPTVRQAVRQQSPIFLATSHFIDRFVGSDKEFLMGYGFPSNRAMKVAVHLGFYAEVGSMSELRLTDAASEIGDLWYHAKEIALADFDSQAAVVDGLWQQQLSSLGSALMLRKDSARMRYRYLQHPDHHYRLWLLRHRLTGRPLALVVLKEEAERMLLMDVIGDRAQLERALRLTAALVRKQGNKPLVFWLSTAIADTIHLQKVEIVRLPISTPANVWTDSPPPEQLRDRWWLTAGDTDFL